MLRGVGGALAILTTTAVLASAGDDGPPLTAPALEPPASSTEPRPEVKPPPRRPFLVIPGVTAPAAATRAPGRPTAVPDPPTPPPPPISPPAADPPLAGPATSATRGTPAPMVTIPLTLEPIPEDRKAGGADTGKPDSIERRATKPEVEVDEDEPSGGRRSPATALGRFLGFDSGRDDVKNAIRVESKSDPAVDAAVKRRIEKSVKDVLGDRASDVEVRVQGRTVLIRARASRFWHRRGVRRALDSFPLPSGYHGRAELMD